MVKRARIEDAGELAELAVQLWTEHDPEELTEEYGAQLAWYRTALARLTGKPVRECWLYSLHLGQAVPCGPAAETV